MLLLAGPRAILEAGWHRGDVGQLTQITRLPGGLWKVVLLALAVTALWLGGSWLLPM